MGTLKKRMLFISLMIFSCLAPLQYVELNALEYEFANAKKLDVPVRELAIIATEEGFYPEAFSIFAGEKIRFFLTTTSNTPSCLIIGEKELYLSATKGNVSEGTAYFEKAGNYKFYCPTNKIKGRLSVIKRPRTAEEILDARSRKIASENKIKVWYPKEE
jgi:plastocyanin